MPTEHLNQDAGIRQRIHEWVHRTSVLERRTDRLVRCLDEMIPPGSSILDVGCGNGAIGSALAARAGRRVVGVETRARASCAIPLLMFDGYELPVQSDSVDWVMFVDVLHHADDPGRVVADACRVAREGLIVKDHYGDSRWSRWILSLMDWFGNRHLDVDLQDNYLSHDQWAAMWKANDLEVGDVRETLDLYPASLKPLFENGLHFVARLTLDRGPQPAAPA